MQCVKYCKKIKLLDSKELLTPKTTQKVQVLSPAVTYNRTLSNIKQIIQNDWSILNTNKIFGKTKARKNSLEKAPSKAIKIYKIKTTNVKGNVNLVNLEYGHCIVYRYKTHIHFVANKSYFVIYLLGCKKCQIQYVGKDETDFNLRLNGKYVYRADDILASRHLDMKDHIVN